MTRASGDRASISPQRAADRPTTTGTHHEETAFRKPRGRRRAGPRRRQRGGRNEESEDRHRGRLSAVQLDRPERQARRLRHRHRQGAVQGRELRVRVRRAGLGRHHPGPDRQEVRRDRRLDVDHRQAQGSRRLHRQVLQHAGQVRRRQGLRLHRIHGRGWPARRSACSARPSTRISLARRSRSRRDRDATRRRTRPMPISSPAVSTS